MRTMRTHILRIFLWPLVLVLFVAAGCTSAPPARTQAPSINEIISMSRAGVPENEIIARMQQSGAVYPLTASQLADLRSQGVGDSVINYMQKTYVASRQRPGYGTPGYYELYGPGSEQPPVYGRRG